jgi:hypothetical protein
MAELVFEVTQEYDGGDPEQIRLRLARDEVLAPL